MARQVAAIYRRDVLRLQRLKRFSVVPIEKMPAEFSQFLERREGEFYALEKLQRRNVAQVVRRHCGQQQQPYVGRGGAVSGYRRRILLKIIRREPVIFSANKSFKEAPGTASYSLGQLNVGIAHDLALRRSQSADPVSNEW